MRTASGKQQGGIGLLLPVPATCARRRLSLWELSVGTEHTKIVWFVAFKKNCRVRTSVGTNLAVCDNFMIAVRHVEANLLQEGLKTQYHEIHG